jgi:N-acetylmuramoyl-L-alanine amidase
VLIEVIDVSAQTNRDVYNERPSGVRGEITAIVLHHTGGVDSLGYLSGNPLPRGKSVHKLFAKPGVIYKIVPDRLRAWHAGESFFFNRGDWNNFSIGYEIENLGTGLDPYTDAQYESVAQSIAYDSALYKISDDWVRCHREIASPRGRRSDPDPTFDLERLWDRVYEIRAAWPFGDNPALWFKRR